MVFPLPSVAPFPAPLLLSRPFPFPTLSAPSTQQPVCPQSLIFFLPVHAPPRPFSPRPSPLFVLPRPLVSLAYPPGFGIFAPPTP